MIGTARETAGRGHSQSGQQPLKAIRQMPQFSSLATQSPSGHAVPAFDLHLHGARSLRGGKRPPGCAESAELRHLEAKEGASPPRVERRRQWSRRKAVRGCLQGDWGGGRVLGRPGDRCWSFANTALLPRRPQKGSSAFFNNRRNAPCATSERADGAERWRPKPAPYEVTPETTPGAPHSLPPLD